MSLMTLLDHAAGGTLYSELAQNLSLDEVTMRNAMAKLCPAIAAALHDQAAKDDELFQSLLDLIEDGEEAATLDSPRSVTSAEAMADGARILSDVYGSRERAVAALRKVEPALPENDLNTLGPICATIVVAAVAKANQPMALAAAQSQQAAGGKSGFFGAVASTIIAGIISALVKQFSPRRRRTTNYSAARNKRRTSRSRTATTRRSGTASASLENVFKDILNNLGK